MRLLNIGYASDESRAPQRIGEHARLGQPYNVSDQQIQALLSPSNPVRSLPYDAQIEYHHLPLHGKHAERTLQTNLQKRTNGARRYKKTKVKAISSTNKEKRIAYGEKRKHDTIQSYWQFVYFTDEAHIDPSEFYSHYVLREPGKDARLAPENLQEVSERGGVKLHIAAWINWHEKTEELTFYNDEHDNLPKPKKPPKPRKSKYQSTETYQQKVKDWAANLPHDCEVKPKGNSMTQQYYTEKLLPGYIRVIEQGKRRYGRAILQEDNDPSHGTKSTNNVAAELKQKHGIEILIHPAQSPDLNPIEAAWNILKQRIIRRQWKTLLELKRILQEEWKAITMEEIRARIAEMPDRCQLLCTNGGKAIKSNLW